MIVQPSDGGKTCNKVHEQVLPGGTGRGINEPTGTQDRTLALAQVVQAATKPFMSHLTPVH